MAGAIGDGGRAVRELFEAGTSLGRTDAELLERFAIRRDESAFAALVDRHGPMVLRACRGVVGDHHMALDAFQATFLVLAKKGTTLRERGSLGPWLHRVACRASTRAIRAEARRRAAERRAAERSPAWTSEPPSSHDRDETAAAVQHEVDRLPEAYREAVVLCDLQGLTCDEAARRLGRPPGTVASRLSRGRGRLRDSLTRRGFAPREGVLIGGCPALPEGLSESAARVAVEFLASSAGPRGLAASLALGVLRAMTRTAWWKTAAMALTLAASTTGVVAVAARGAGGGVDEDPAAPPPSQAKPDAGTVEVRPRVFSAVVKDSGTRVIPGARNDVAVTNPFPEALPVRSVLANGTRVAKGQVVCELDVSGSVRELAETMAAHEAAQKDAAVAQSTKQAARLAVAEYEEGTFPAELTALQIRLSAAEAASKEAMERAGRTKDAQGRLRKLMDGQGGVKSPADILAELELQDRYGAAELALQAAQGERDEATARIAALQQHARPRALAALQVEVEKAEVALSAREAELARLAAREEPLRRRIDQAKILAPADGVVVANELTKAAASATNARYDVPGLAKILSIASPADRFWFQVTLVEGSAARVAVGMPATVKVTVDVPAHLGHTPDGSPLTGSFYLRGTVAALSPGPVLASDAGNSLYNAEIEVQGVDAEAFAALERPHEGLQIAAPERPDERLQVEIQAAREGPSVPIGAVVRYDDRDHVAVRQGEGGVDWRDVELGFRDWSREDGEYVQVVAGLNPGVRVVVDPTPLLSDDQRRKLQPPSSRPDPARAALEKRAQAAQAIFAKLGSWNVLDRPPIDPAARAKQEEELKALGLTDAEIALYREFPPGGYGTQ